MNWLGKVPQHWEVRRLKTFSQIRYGLGQPPREAPDGLPLVRATNVSQGQIVEEDMVYVDPADVPTGRNAFLSEGEIIVVRSGAYTADSAIIPKRYSGAVTGYDLVVTVTEALPEFVACAALAAYVRDDQLVVASLRAAQPHLNAEELGSACFFLPPLSEQTAIARFLDTADRRIRRYIRAKERLIELLEERKRALIHEAVTGRIDVRTGQPYPAYKDSGVEWLGKVPQHWEVRRLKTFSQIRYGLGQPPREAPDGLPLVRATNVSQGQIVEEDMVYVDPADVPTGRNAFLSEGEIIVVRSGAYTADSAIIPKRYSGAVTGYDLVVTVTEALPEFVACAALAAYVRDDQLVVASLRAAQPHLNAEELGSARFFLPPLSEQTAIVRFLDATDRRIQRQISATKRQIALLKEYRTRLIADVVTGKLDVREAAVDLPETDPFARNRDRAGTIPTESNLHPIEHDMAKEAVP